jgi:Transcription elongation factor, GreA/GreB, C-term
MVCRGGCLTAALARLTGDAWQQEQDMTTCIKGRTDVVAVGSIITVSDEGGRADIYQIVSDGEADAAQGRISESTPLARAVLGHGIGERVEVRGPGGLRWLVTIEGATSGAGVSA